MVSVESTRAIARMGATAGDMAGDAVRLRELPGVEYTPADALRLREIVESGPAELTAGLPRQRSGGSTLDHELERIVEPSPYQLSTPQTGEHLEPFLAAWRHQSLPAAEQAEVLRRLQTTPAANYGPEDWATFDAVVSARPPHTMPDTLPGMRDRVGDLAASGMRGRAGDADTLALQRVLDAWRVADMSPAEVAAESTRLRSLAAESYTPHDWSMLDALQGSGAYASRITMPAKLSGASDFDRLIRHYRSGEWQKPEREMLRYLAAWRATSMTDDELAGATRALVGRDPATFTAKDWRALQAVTDANELRGDPLRMPAEPSNPHAHALRELIGNQNSHIRYHPAVFRHHFAEWMPRLDRTWEARSREAMRAVANGDAATFEPNMPTAIANRTDADIWNLSGREQVRLGVALLRNGELSTSRIVEVPLLLVSEGLDDVGELAPQLRQLVDDTKGLADHNLAIIEGRIPSGGYKNHPDYAHVGRIIENATLIERALSVPHVSAPARVDPADAKLAETLTW